MSVFASARSERRTIRSLALPVATLATSALLLTGCGSTGGGDDGDSAGGPATLTVLNQSRGQEEALNALAAQYSEENDITVTVDTPGPADYIAKLQAAAQSDDMPDLFSAIGATDMAPFYRAGWALNLEPELEAGWSESFVPALIDITTFSEGNAFDIPAGVYGAHYDIASYGLYVNPANVNFDVENPPATMEELVAEFGTGGVDGNGQFSVAASLTPQLIQYFASNFMTDAEIDATFAGEASWETSDWEKTFQLLSDMADADAIASGSIPGGSDDNANVEKSFFNTQDLGAIFDSTAAVAVAKSTAPDFTAYSSAPLPAAEGATEQPRAAAASGKGFAVNARGDHSDEALAFLKWLTEPEQQQYFVDNAGFVPTNPELLESGALAPQLQGLGAALSDFQAVPSSLTPDVRDVVVRSSQSLILGEVDVADVLADVQAAQDLSR